MRLPFTLSSFIFLSISSNACSDFHLIIMLLSEQNESKLISKKSFLPFQYLRERTTSIIYIEIICISFSVTPDISSRFLKFSTSQGYCVFLHVFRFSTHVYIENNVTSVSQQSRKEGFPIVEGSSSLYLVHKVIFLW